MASRLGGMEASAVRPLYRCLGAVQLVGALSPGMPGASAAVGA